MAVSIEKRLFTVDEYYRMADSGILTRDDRVELIEGEIVTMTPIGIRHNGCVIRLNALLHAHFGQAVVLEVPGPVRLSAYSEPEPDLALLRPRADYYTTTHPGPADVLLLIEVADSSLAYDRGVKLPLYARAGIPEVWILNLAGEVVETYAQPRDGQYQVTARAGRGESVTAHSVAGLTCAVDAILG